MQRVGVVEGAIGGAERFASLAALFPHVAFEPAGRAWPDRAPAGLDILIASVGPGGADLDTAIRRLEGSNASVKTVVALADADVTTTRRLVRAGAADVLPAPVSEAALALCLERLLAASDTAGDNGDGRGEIVTLLKAGGGVGATSLAVQMASIMAHNGSGAVCVADLDLQFGAASIYLDLPDALTIADCLSSGTVLSDTPFATALSSHPSGVRVLAAPREIVAMEMLNAAQVDGLVKGLRREFATTIVDLPPVWTAWTNHLVQESDRIVMVTHLTVPHIQLVKRQLRILATQRLDDRPITLVCNALSPDHAASVPVKAAERALGRSFDVVIPEDRKVMMQAINQGIEISSVRRNTKLEKAIAELAQKLVPAAPIMRRVF